MKRWLYKWLPIIFGCHCKEERSFHYKGKRFPICARCTGELAGMIVAMFSCFFFRLPLLWAVLILVPMMMAFLYIYYGLAPGCWQNIIEKELEIVDDGINVKMYIYPKKDKIDEQDSKQIVDKWADFDKEEDTESTEEVEDSTAEESMPEPDAEVLHRNRLICWNEIKQMKVSSDRIFLTLTDRPLGFLHIPISSLSDATAFIQVLKSRISVK